MEGEQLKVAVAKGDRTDSLIQMAQTARRNDDLFQFGRLELNKDVLV